MCIAAGGCSFTINYTYEMNLVAKSKGYCKYQKKIVSNTYKVVLNIVCVVLKVSEVGYKLCCSL